VQGQLRALVVCSTVGLVMGCRGSGETAQGSTPSVPVASPPIAPEPPSAAPAPTPEAAAAPTAAPREEPRTVFMELAPSQGDLLPLVKTHMARAKEKVPAVRGAQAPRE
jgi:hypothetical protein